MRQAGLGECRRPGPDRSGVGQVDATGTGALDRLTGAEHRDLGHPSRHARPQIENDHAMVESMDGKQSTPGGVQIERMDRRTLEMGNGIHAMRHEPDEGK